MLAATRLSSSTACGRPAASAPSKRDLIVNVFLRQEGHISADDLVDLIRARGSSSISRATVYRTLQWMVDAGHRAQGRFRRGPVPVRALLPASAALSPDLQVLQPVLRVPQLRHRGAGRGGRRGAQLHAAAERAADLRHVRGLPHRTAGRAAEGGVDRAAVRARRAAHRDCDRAQRPRVLHARGAASRATRAAGGVREAGRGREGASRHARGALPRAARAGSRSSSRGRRSCSSRARPTACSPPAPRS